MAKTDLTAERLRELLDYNPETGVFTWVSCAGRYGRFQKGSETGSLNQRGYQIISIGCVKYIAHQLAWLFVNGTWCESQIDHIDGNKANNSICNLREANQSENSQNQSSAHSNNKSGFLGVSIRKNGTYQARIMVDKKSISIGYFDTAELAHEAYLLEKKHLHQFGFISKMAPEFAPVKRSFESRSKSGFRGVTFDKRYGKWIARPYIAGKQRTIGQFDSAEDAYQKCLDAKNEIH